ncbi:ABC transporter permease [Micromonospora luteifusca]|uniref:ABC transporter permease n=1 Tax=Micromonospora luteifusca TaxID=709860 RepID=UPI0033B2AF07
MSATAVATDETEPLIHRDPPPKRPFGLARHSLVLARRSLLKTLRNLGGMGDATIMPIIFLVMFVYLFGGAVAGSTHDYLQYIFPSILVMTVIIAGMMATGINLNVDIKKGVFDRFRTLPIARLAPMMGSVLGDMIRYFVAIAVLFGFGSLLGFRVETNVLAALAACGLTVLFGFCLSWVYVLVGILIRETSGVQSVILLSMFPLAFGTDMVAPVDTMPGWLQAWVRVNPVTDVMDASRGLLTGGPVADALLRTLIWSAGLLVVFVPAAIWAYRRRT